MDDEFFKGFSKDLHNPDIWRDYHTKFRSANKRLKDIANPTQLGDPVSLKAETAVSSPTHDDRGTQSSSSPSSENKTPRKTLKELANPTQLGDPVSLKAEAADTSPTDQDRGAQPGTSGSQSSSSEEKTPKKRLKDIANPTQLGDPVSLKAEAANSSPTDQDKGARSSSPAEQGSSPESKTPKKRLKDLANPTLLGDPVSLKAEAADSSPTDQDKGAESSTSNEQPPPSEEEKPRKRLKDLANPTQLGDPVSLKAEAADSSPTDQDRGAKSSSSQSFTDKEPHGNRPPYNNTKDTTNNNTSSNEPQELISPDLGSVKGTPPSASPATATSPSPGDPSWIGPLPKIDASALFWEMMRVSREPDPYIYPALLTLKASKKFILGALSNTVIFPPTHSYSEPSDLLSHFDVFISSAAVGMRKPHREVYELTLSELDKFERETRGGKGGVKAEEVVFLDDIGENLKMGKEVGMQTIRVRLGETWKAVKELERLTGMKLMDGEKTIGKAKL